MVSSVVQSNGAHGTTNPRTIVLGSAPTVGNTLVAIMASDTTHTGVPTAGAGNSYTQRLAQVGGQGFYVWTRLVVGGESATTTFTPNGASPAALHVIEIQGTYDKVGAGTTNTGSAAASRTATGLSPTTTDNIVLAIAGLHAVQASAPSGGSADNSFTLTLATHSGGTGFNCGIITAHKATGAISATGTTTLSWTNNYNDRDGIQIAFTGITVIPPATGPMRTESGARIGLGGSLGWLKAG